MRDHGRQLLFVIGVLGDLGRDDDLRVIVHSDLGIVGLHETAFVRAVGHDPAVRIGEVALRLRIRRRLLRIGNPRLASTRLLPRSLLLLPPLGHPRFRVRLRLRRLLPGFRFQFRPGLSNLLQPAFPPRQFLRQLVGGVT